MTAMRTAVVLSAMMLTIACAPRTARVASVLNMAHTVAAIAETEPVNSEGDAADDPAVWVNEKDLAGSRIIGTQKKGGLYVYDLNGVTQQFVPAGRLNNVDIRPGFAFSGGAAPIVVASDRDDQSIAVFRFDEANGLLDPAQVMAIPSGFVEVYGVCLYHAPDGKFRVIATSKTGDVKQWSLALTNGALAATELSSVSLGTISEGCVADDARGQLYVAQEEKGLWRMPLDGTGERTMIDGIAPNGNLVADVEGVTLYDAGNGQGYLVVSSQGNSTFVLYDRLTGKYAGTFKVAGSADGRIDEVSGTDGLDVSAANLRPDLSGGVLIVQDDVNSAPDATQNFKIVPWSEVRRALKLP